MVLYLGFFNIESDLVGYYFLYARAYLYFFYRRGYKRLRGKKILGDTYNIGSTIGLVQSFKGVTLNLTGNSGGTLTSTATVAHITHRVTFRCAEVGGDSQSSTVDVTSELISTQRYYYP